MKHLDQPSRALPCTTVTCHGQLRERLQQSLLEKRVWVLEAAFLLNERQECGTQWRSSGNGMVGDITSLLPCDGLPVCSASRYGFSKGQPKHPHLAWTQQSVTRLREEGDGCSESEALSTSRAPSSLFPRAPNLNGEVHGVTAFLES